MLSNPDEVPQAVQNVATADAGGSHSPPSTKNLCKTIQKVISPSKLPMLPEVVQLAMRQSPSTGPVSATEDNPAFMVEVDAGMMFRYELR